MPEIGCFIHMGGCQNENEALFLRFLARLPVDVVILVRTGMYHASLRIRCCMN